MKRNHVTPLEADLDWREAEIGSLKKLVTASNESSPQHIALLRALWTMAYAHFEGFTQFAWDFYLDELQKSGLPRREVRDEIAKQSLKKTFNVLRGKISDDDLWDFFRHRFNLLLDANLVFETKLTTKSNLWPSTYKENCRAVGLPHEILDEHETEIRTLVSRRNSIAHGQKMIVNSLLEYTKHETAVFYVMHELAVAIMESLDNKTYRLPAPPE